MPRDSKCVECGGDAFHLSDLGVDPNICGWCNGWICPTHDIHTACAPKIAQHNAGVRLKELERQRARVDKEIEELKNAND